MNFNDRFNAAFPYMLPQGLNLTSLPQVPIQGPIPLPMPRPIGAEVPTVVYNSPGGPATDPNAPPFRLDRGAPPPVEAPLSPPAMVAPTRALASSPSFPTGETSAVPYTKPVVQAGAQGVTLNSNPAAGWEGSVGAEAPAKVAEAAPKPDYDKLMAGVEDIAKGFKKSAADPSANQIIPSNMQPNSGSGAAAELMAALLGAKKRPMGVTLTG